MKNIVIGTTYVDFKSRGQTERSNQQSVALQVLSELSSNIYPVAVTLAKDPEYEELKELGIPQLRLLKRDTSQNFTACRTLPYVKDIMNVLALIDCDVFGFVNSDILVSERVCSVLQKEYEGFILQRTDLENSITKEEFQSNRLKDVMSHVHVGVDGFFFQKFWWLKYRHLFPNDLILAETEWDTCYRQILFESSNWIQTRCLYHVYHSQGWNTYSPLAQNNLKIWLEVK